MADNSFRLLKATTRVAPTLKNSVFPYFRNPYFGPLLYKKSLLAFWKPHSIVLQCRASLAIQRHEIKAWSFLNHHFAYKSNAHLIKMKTSENNWHLPSTLDLSKGLFIKYLNLSLKTIVFVQHCYLNLHMRKMNVQRVQVSCSRSHRNKQKEPKLKCDSPSNFLCSVL